MKLKEKYKPDILVFLRNKQCEDLKDCYEELSQLNLTSAYLQDSYDNANSDKEQQQLMSILTETHRKMHKLNMCIKILKKRIEE